MPDRFESEPYAEIGRDLAAIEKGFQILYRRIRKEILTEPIVRIFPMPEKMAPDRKHCKAISLSTGRPCLNVPTFPCGLCGKHYAMRAKIGGPHA